MKNNKEVKYMLPSSIQQPTGPPKVKVTPEKVRETVEIWEWIFQYLINVARQSSKEGK